MPERWPVQVRFVALVLDAIGRGVRRLLVTSPTGTGKSLAVCDLITRLVGEGWCVILYTNRRLLIDQLCGVLDAQGIDYGVRAAGFDADEGKFWPVQISSLPTERSRVLRRKVWDIFARGQRCLAVIDEAHVNDGPQDRQVVARHVEAGHFVLGVTATPLGLGESYDELLVAGTVSEGRECGALVEALQYDFASPDLRGVRGAESGEDLSEPVVRKAMMRPGLIGRVFDAFDRLNPTRRPTILFAPGVAESVWFAEEFTKRGVSAAHIDGENVWLGGRLYRSDRQMRQEVLDASRDGECVVLCNRFVLREGVDCPWLAHGVAATIFGSLQTYLQSGGRLLRNHPSLLNGAITFQDHGGNCFRHGSLNEDREWFLEQTAAMAYGLRADRLRKQPGKQPFRCPACGRMWVRGTICSVARGGCGYALQPHQRSREVVTADGTLRRIPGDYFRPRRVSRKPNGPALWEKMYWRSRTEKGARTFAAAEVLFAKENNWGYPDPAWPLMPTNDRDRYRLVADVPVESLVPKPAGVVTP